MGSCRLNLIEGFHCLTQPLRSALVTLRLYGCSIGPSDAGSLIEALNAEGSPISLETAAAIRWGVIHDLAADEIEPDMQAAILQVTAGNAGRSSPALT